ncbi:hypothetical protein HHI36_022007 [Cryptolaemus montrouzieri]|uniref:Endothelin-converting enzyme 1 n=1 Tax=Cryptolaemus montrouzieri TaxID=559131 RepID=A0ABD2MYF8_9CUCU
MEDILATLPRTFQPESVRKVKEAYKSCMDLILADTRRPTPEAILIAETGGMPLFQENRTQPLKFGWNDLAKLSASYGLPLLFKITVIPYPISTTDNLIELDSEILPDISMSHPYDPDSKSSFLELLNEDFKTMAENKKLNDPQSKPFDVFLEKMVDLLRDNINPNVTDDKLKEGIQDVAEFIRRIQNYEGIPKGVNISYIESTTTIGNLQKWTDEQFPNESLINWSNYLETAVSKAEVRIEKNMNIFVNTTYAYNVLNILKNTNPETVKNYALLRILAASSVDSNWQMRKAFSDYYNAKTSRMFSRADYCASQLTDLILSDATIGMSFAAGRLYEENNFNTHKLTQAAEMMQDILKTFKNTLSTSDWMDDESKGAALRKADNAIFLYGLPDFASNDTQLDEFYENLNIITWDNYGNMQRIRAFKQAYIFAQLGKPRDRAYWDKSPFDTNAFYNRPNNKIIMPLAMLNPVFFGGKIKLMDYSHLGMLVGHEITHGFDNVGRQYDENATLGDLWTAETLLNFQNKTKCFEKQYSNYFVKELNKTVDGTLSLNENLADNGGLQNSYKTAKSFFDLFELESKEFTSEQLFFLGFGTNFCSVSSVPYLEYTLSKGYSTSEYRVIGAASNMVEFAKAFNCPKNSKMNPEVKCLLW